MNLKKTTIIAFSMFLLSVNCSISFAGGPWILKKKSGYLQVQSTVVAYPYTRLLTGTAIRDSRGINREVFSADFGIYGEYGITNKLDILANVPLKYAKAGDLTDSLYFPNLLDEGSIAGLSNVRLGLKYGVLDKKVKIALSAQASFNSATSDLDKGLATGFLGNAYGLFGHIGGSLNSNWYAFLEIGYMNYSNNLSDVIEERIEIGRKFGSKITMMLTTDIRRSLDNGSYYNENLIQTGLYPNDQEWIAGSWKINYESDKKIGANFGMPLIPIKFRNVGFTGSFTLGVYKKW